MSDYTSYKVDYDRDGFVLVRNFLPPDELKDLTAQGRPLHPRSGADLTRSGRLLPRQGPGPKP